MQLLLAGASGFLGQALSRFLAQQGHQVVRLVRADTVATDEARWDPARGEVDQELIEWADVVVNLAGASNVHFPWTDSYRRTFLESRTRTTRTLAEAIARSERKPAFLAQNGVAGYGDRGSDPIDESTPDDADSYMGDVTRQWQAATEPAVEAGARVVVMRTGVILDKSGGALKQMLPPFRLGLGGPIGPGTQYFATISLDDWVGAAAYLAAERQCVRRLQRHGARPVHQRGIHRRAGTCPSAPGEAARAGLRGSRRGTDRRRGAFFATRGAATSPGERLRLRRQRHRRPGQGGAALISRGRPTGHARFPADGRG